jgi:hypothetical protein
LAVPNTWDWYRSLLPDTTRWLLVSIQLPEPTDQSIHNLILCSKLLVIWVLSVVPTVCSTNISSRESSKFSKEVNLVKRLWLESEWALKRRLWFSSEGSPPVCTNEAAAH